MAWEICHNRNVRIGKLIRTTKIRNSNGNSMLTVWLIELFEPPSYLSVLEYM